MAEWHGGNLTQQAYAKKKGIAPTTLSWWACRLRREARERQALVPVDVVSDAPSNAAEFRVEVSGGRTVRVPASFDAVALRRLLAALEEEGC